MRKSVTILTLVLSVLVATALASPNIPAIPRTLSNARFVYVAAYDGDQFDPSLLPADRAAITHVQDAIQKWGKLTLVYRPQDADIILLVQSRPSEDVMALYDAHGATAQFLWRVMGRGGLQKGELPLVSQFQDAWERIQR